jgi:hypothetical protein
MQLTFCHIPEAVSLEYKHIAYTQSEDEGKFIDINALDN